jgi:hypothetical protein
MSNVSKGLTAGLVATLVLSALMILNGSLDLFPQINIIRLLTALGTLTVPSAWMDHFIVGVVVWGMLFTGFESLTEGPATWIKGMIFGTFAWLVMMVAFMPLAGAGFFGSKVGGTVVLGLLALHLIYGATLGATFSFLGAFVPVKIPVIVSKEEAIAAGGPNGFTMDSADINDHLPTSNPSGKTLLLAFGCLVAAAGLFAFAMEFRVKLGF